MNTRRLWWLGAAGVVAVLIGAVLVVPAWAAPVGQAGGLTPDAYTAVHAACEARDVQGMTDAMNSLTDGDWEAMEEHMGDGRHAGMGTHMTGEDWQAMEGHMSDDLRLLQPRVQGALQ